MKDELRIAIIGQGFMGRAHTLAWSRAAQLEACTLRPNLALLCGRDAEALRRNEALGGFADSSTDWQVAIASHEIDLVDICAPGALHAPIAVAALEAGKHVLCEKPMANSLAEARVMAEAARRAKGLGKQAMVGFNYRRVPALALARSLVAGGRIGRLYHVRALYLQDWLTDANFPLTWRLVAEVAGSGALGDLGAHLLDLVRFLTGQEIVELAARLETFIDSRPVSGSSTGLSAHATGTGQLGAVTVDDCVAVSGKLSGGGLLTLEATRMAMGHKNGLSIELNGSLGSIRFDLERLNELEVTADEPASGFVRHLATDPTDPYVGQWWPPGHLLGWEHSFVHQCQDFMDCIASGEEPSPSFNDGLRVQGALDAIVESAERHERVAVTTR